MAFHQHLETELDFRGGRSRVEPKRIERPALGVADDTALPPTQALAFGVGTVRAKMAKQVEGIVDVIEMRLEPRRMGPCRRTTAVHAHLPGRPVADNSLLLVTGDVVLAHAGEEIVGVVVLAHMTKAETPVFVLARAALRGAMGRGSVATGPFAARVLGAQPTILVGLDPYAVEQGRVAGHDSSLCRRWSETFKS